MPFSGAPAGVGRAAHTVRSSSVASSGVDTASPASAFSGFTGGAGGVGGALSDADFKDTVLFMQQQQAMNHAQIIDMLRRVAGSLEALRGAAPSSSSAVVQQRAATEAAAEEPPAELLLGSDFDAERLLSGGWEPRRPVTGLGVSEGEVELRAARGRIASLEAAVQQLQTRVRTQDETIRQLTDVAIAHVHTRAASGGAVHSSPAAAFAAAPVGAADLHKRAVEALLVGLQPPDSPERRLIPGVGVAAATPGGGGGGAPAPFAASPSVRQLLQQHQQRCAQVMLQ